MKKIFTISLLVFITTLTNAQEKWTTYTIANGLVSNYVTSIAIDAQGNKWFGTNKGVSKFDGIQWTTYTTANGLSSNNVTSIAIDKLGNKWFGTKPESIWNGVTYVYEGGGVSKFDGFNWTTYTIIDGLASNFVSAIIIDSLGNKWFGTLPYTNGGPFIGGGVSKFNDTTWTTYTKTDGLVHNEITSLSNDVIGNIWVGTYGNGISKFINNKWETFNLGFDNLKWPIDINTIFIDNNLNKWVGFGETLSCGLQTHVGVYNENDSLIEKYKFGDGFTNGSKAIHTIISDEKNTIWLGGGYGLSKFDGSSWIFYTDTNGLASNYVTSIAIDAQGNKWIGTYEGISKLEDSGAGSSNLTYKIQRCIVFEDNNSNGIKDNNEICLPNQIIQIDSCFNSIPFNGILSTFLTKGLHTFKYTPNKYRQLTTDSLFTINITTSTKTDTIFWGIKPIQNINDVTANIVGTTTRAGFQSQYYINCENVGTITQNGTIVFNLDPHVTIINTAPAADTVDKNRLVWNVHNLFMQQQKEIYLYTKMPNVQALGDTLLSTVAFNIFNKDTNLINNYDTIRQRVTGSYDPNNKEVKEGIGSKGFILFNKPLSFTIHFQNTGTDTAFNVNIRDTLNNNLDLSTLKIIASSHPVRLELRGTSEATFHFDNIMLPDSNVNEPASNGFIKYSIMPNEKLPENTLVENKAYIFFDFNPAIITNETKNTYVSVIPDVVENTKDKSIELKNSFSIYPNPTKQNVTITFNSNDKVNSIEILNTIGQTVYTKYIQTTKNAEHLDLSSLQNGIYFIKVKSDNGNFIKKFVKD